MLDGMRLKISSRNSKIGEIPNLSLPPVATCEPLVPCIKECYAKNAYLRWPNVKNAWDHNLELYRDDPDGFFYDLCLFLAMEQPARFRLFVGGDFPDEEFLVKMIDVVDAYPSTSVLCFTKRYDFVEKHTDHIPQNFKIIVSVWPGRRVPELIEVLPSAWLSTDNRFGIFFKGEPYVKCPGRCDQCQHKCWDAVSRDLPVMFDLH